MHGSKEADKMNWTRISVLGSILLLTIALIIVLALIFRQLLLVRALSKVESGTLPGCPLTSNDAAQAPAVVDELYILLNGNTGPKR